MKIVRDVKSNSIIIITGILLISLLLNVYQFIDNTKYKNELAMTSYKNIEEIRTRNEFVLDLLDKCIVAGKVTNEDLLSLYKNYTKIVTAEVELWNHYLNQKGDLKNLVEERRIDESNINNSEVYWNIEEVIFSCLTRDDKVESELKLKDKLLEDFYIMKNISKEMDDFFVTFNSKYLESKEGEEKSVEVIKKKYWVDILNGIHKINEKYIDYQFIVE